MAAFASRVRDRMERDGIEQHELAAAIGMPPSTLSQHLSGRLQPETVQKIERYWPDEFGGCLQEALRVKFNITEPLSYDPVFVQEIVASLQLIRAAVGSMLDIVEGLTSGGDINDAGEQAGGAGRPGKGGRGDEGGP